MPRVAWIALTAGSLTLVGCGGAETEAEAQPTRATAGAERSEVQPETQPEEAMGGDRAPGHRAHASDSRAAHEEGCPMQIPGVSLRTEPIDQGVALVFTTTEPEHVVELRESVRVMAPMHAQQLATAEGALMRPPSEVVVVDLVDGARVDLRAEDAREVATLRRQAGMWADLMIRGACPLIPPQHAAADPPRRSAEHTAFSASVACGAG